MSKFLNIVEDSTPSQDFDQARSTLMEIEYMLKKHGINASRKIFKDVITIRYNNKIVDLELKDIVSDTKEEDGEDDVMAALLNTNDDHLKSNPAALKAKKDLTTSATIIANAAKIAASRISNPSY